MFDKNLHKLSFLGAWWREMWNIDDVEVLLEIDLIKTSLPV